MTVKFIKFKGHNCNKMCTEVALFAVAFSSISSVIYLLVTNQRTEIMKTNRATRKLVQKQTYNFEFEMALSYGFL